MDLGQLFVKIAGKVSLEALHPIGETVWNDREEFDPSALWGGTWEQISTTDDRYCWHRTA